MATVQPLEETYLSAGLGRLDQTTAFWLVSAPNDELGLELDISAPTLRHLVLNLGETHGVCDP